jgi:6-phosphogluconolactonase (cycloisomerase 2 family)
MFLYGKSFIVSLVGFILIFLFIGCGGESDKSTQIDKYTNIDKTQDNSDETNQTDDQNNTQPIYRQNGKTLIEIRADTTKRAWVNSTSKDCLIYRIRDLGGNIADGGADHCQNLNNRNFEGITSWRMPTVEEALYLMSHVSVEGENSIIYPNDNPNCLYMATDKSNHQNGDIYVYTTNHQNSGSFVDQNRKVAGIRCVADIE